MNTEQLTKFEFGDYALIEQKRYGCENEMFVYKVIGQLRSNSWVDVPVQTPATETLHSSIEDVCLCICCGIDETEVKRFLVKDMKPRSSNNNVLAQALLEANGKVQALAAENSAHKSAFNTILEHCPVNHPDIDKAVVAMIAYDDAFNRVTPATAAAVAQIEARVRGEIIDWFETEIMAIDPIYRGYPSYEHGGYDIKHKALFLVERAKKAFVKTGEAK